MESRNTADLERGQSARPFGLLDLCEVLDLSKAQLERLLWPVHEIRDAGIFVRTMTADELAEFQPDPSTQPLRRSHMGDLNSAVLPLPFSADELLKFLDLPTEVPYEIERRLTNDPGAADLRPTIDEAAFQRLAVNCAGLAAVLRPLLSAGAGAPAWWLLGQVPGPRTAPTSDLAAPEDANTRRMRRLARLRQLGGDMRRAGDSWQVVGKLGAQARLIREEAAAHRPMADKTDVRADLAKAMDAETGGQRGT